MSVESIFQHNAALEAFIRSVARDSQNVIFPERLSGHLGEIGISQIYATLERGVVHLNPEPNEYEHIVCTLRLDAPDGQLFVDIAVDVSKKEIHVLHAEIGG